MRLARLLPALCASAATAEAQCGRDAQEESDMLALIIALSLPVWLLAEELMRLRGARLVAPAPSKASRAPQPIAVLRPRPRSA